MKTTVTELSDTKVRIDAEVPADGLEKKIKAAAAHLGTEMKISGFREGKVPPEMVLQRVGREAVLTEAIESSIAELVEQALLGAAITPVGDPQLKIGDLPGENEPLSFSIEVGVRPKAELGEYKGLEVGREEIEVPKDAVEAELERLRTASPSSTRSSARPRTATSCSSTSTARSAVSRSKGERAATS